MTVKVVSVNIRGTGIPKSVTGVNQKSDLATERAPNAGGVYS